MLAQIAESTGGTYHNAADEEDLRAIYDNLDPQWVVKPEEMEVTSMLAGASILVLLVAGSFSMLWFGRVP
jgi:Ca-activated chloride channel family protein